MVYAEYGIAERSLGDYEVDHLVPLELGGSNDVANLWPEAAAPPPGFHEKDLVENSLHDRVCAGSISAAGCVHRPYPADHRHGGSDSPAYGRAVEVAWHVAAGGGTPSWTSGRSALHHCLVADGIASRSWRDGGLSIDAEGLLDDVFGDNLLVRVRGKPGGRTRLHAHDSDQLLVITCGSTLIATQTEEHVLEPGTVVWVPAGVPHRHGTAGDTEGETIYITRAPYSTTIFDTDR
jgi:quercetin dioxygenase-like cupin family protein